MITRLPSSSVHGKSHVLEIDWFDPDKKSPKNNEKVFLLVDTSLFKAEAEPDEETPEVFLGKYYVDEHNPEYVFDGGQYPAIKKGQAWKYTPLLAWGRIKVTAEFKKRCTVCKTVACWC